MSSSASAYGGGYGGAYGGAGGKFSKKPPRKSHPKPYDRPTQPANNNNNNNNENNNNNYWWFSKIIEAPHKLYSFVFGEQRRSDEGKEIEDVQPETAANVVDSATKLPVDCGGNYDGSGAAELEDRLKQKVFTRPEIDQLSALLLSRTNENLDGAEKGISGAKLSDLQDVPTNRDKLFTVSARENNINCALSGIISTPDVKSKVLPGDAASPAEIAKAYMAGRSTEVSLSVSRLHNHLLDEVASPSNSLSRSVSPAMYLNQKAASNIKTSSNGFMTPRFRGRSIIHNNVRTPYSRDHPVMSPKVAETNFRIGGGSSYHNVTENSHYSKQAIKRRRSVLENDIGSVGPIRRIRQKSNLLHPKTLGLPSPGGHQETHVTGVLSDVSKGFYSVEHGSQNRSFQNVLGMRNAPASSSRFVPSQSIEMAQKIFEHLDKFSPKVVKKPAPESVESLKCSPSSQDMTKTKRSLDYVHEHNDVTTETSQIAEEGSAKKLTSLSNSLGPLYGNGSKTVVSYPSHKSKAGEYIVPLSIGDRTLEKPATQMSSHELDDHVPLKKVALSTSLIEATQHPESSTKLLAMPDILPTVAVEKALEMKPTAHLEKTELESVTNGCSPSETIVSSPLLPASPANMSMSDVISVPQPTVQSDEVAQQTKMRNFAKAYSSKPDNLPTAIGTLIFAAKDTKCEILVSGNEVAAEVNVPEKTINTNTPVLTSGGNPLFSLPVPTLESSGGDVQSAGPGTASEHTLSSKIDSTPVSVFAPSFLGGSTSSMPSLGSSGSTGLSSVNAFCSIPTTASNVLSKPLTTPFAFTSSSTTSSIFGLAQQAVPPQSVSPAPSLPAFTFGPGSSGGTISTSASNHTPFIFGGSSGLPASASAMAALTSAIPSTMAASAFTFGPGSSGGTTSTSSSNHTPFVFGGSSGLAPSASAMAASTSAIPSAMTASAFTFGPGSSGGTTSTSSSNHTPFVFGGSSGLAPSASAMAASTSAIPPAFGILSSQPSVFASSTCSNNDQMTTEDTMAEDSPQFKSPPGDGCCAPSAHSGVFGFNPQQSQVAPQNSLFQLPSGFSGVFGSNAQQSPVAPQHSLFQPPGGFLGGFGSNTQQTPAAPQNSLFQPPGGFSGGSGFNAQPSPVAPQNSPFQSSGSFNAGPSSSLFSMGASTDKSQRRIFKPKKGARRK